MAYIDTIAPADAEGEVLALYQRQEAHWGYVPNYAKAFSLRPKVLERWAKLLAEIRRTMDDRLFELATFAAAAELRNSACAVVHGRALGEFIGEDTVLAIGAGRESEVLDEADAAVVALARKVAGDAVSVTPADIERLRNAGFDDPTIFDIADAAAGRAYFTKLLDGLGVEPDAGLGRIDAAFRDPLVTGRPLSQQPDECLPGVSAQGASTQDQ